MRLTIQVPSGEDADFINLDVGPDMTTEDLKAAIAIDTNVSADRQILFYNGNPMNEGSKTLGAVGIGEGDMIVMHMRRAPGIPSARQREQPAASARVRDDAEILRLQALGTPRIMEQLRQHRPELASAVQDPQRFREIWDQLAGVQDEAEAEKNRTIARLNADPFDMEAQMKIEEMIREAAVMQNLTEAIENTPEAFGRVHMLYIPVEVNNVHVKAFVDSGAQATIMSPACAEKCGIMRLLDKRFAGIARGVGTARILGRVHAAQIKIGSLYLSCSFTVMEGKDVDLLLGLDMLKRHQALIDLRKGALVIMDQEVPFLGEGDIPKNEILFSEEPTVEGPGGMQMGGRTGAIMAPPSEERPRGEADRPQRQGQTVANTPSAPASATLSQPSQGTYPPAHISQLMDLGFSRNEVLRALQMAGGNLEVAAGILYQ